MTTPTMTFNEQHADSIAAVITPYLGVNANGRNMDNEHHVFDIGERLIIIAEGDGDSSCFQLSARLSTTLVPDLLARLHFVELTIIGARAVGGDYRPEGNHWGYYAKGSDGWYYSCQWEHFDDCSMNPYANWNREFYPGVHYTRKIGAGGRSEIDQWLMPESEFHGHYCNWDITEFRGHFPPVMVQPMIDHVNKLFPVTQIRLCDVDDTDADGKPFNHSRYGPYYVADGECFVCRFRQRQQSREPGQARVNESSAN